LAAVWVRYGSPDVIVREVDLPRLADDDVLVRVRSCGLPEYRFWFVTVDREPVLAFETTGRCWNAATGGRYLR
jgi:NADPH:quinone reductase-like Zn-dependent oxidoreductase